MWTCDSKGKFCGVDTLQFRQIIRYFMFMSNLTRPFWRQDRTPATLRRRHSTRTSYSGYGRLKKLTSRTPVYALTLTIAAVEKFNINFSNNVIMSYFLCISYAMCELLSITLLYIIVYDLPV